MTWKTNSYMNRCLDSELPDQQLSMIQQKYEHFFIAGKSTVIKTDSDKHSDS